MCYDLTGVSYLYASVLIILHQFYHLTRLIVSFLFLSESHDHALELFEFNLTIAVRVNFPDDLFPDALICSGVLAKDLGDLMCGNLAAVVLVKEFEGSPHVTLIHSLCRIDGSRAPFSEVDATAVIGVGLAKDLDSALFNSNWVLFFIQLLVSVDKFVLLDQAITVLVELGESLLHLRVLLLCGEMAGQVGQRSLDHLRVTLDAAKQ